MSYEEWKEKYVDGGEKGVANSGESGIIKSITVNDFEQIYKNEDIDNDCITEIKNALGTDGRYFNAIKIVNIPRNKDGTIDLLRTNIVQRGTWFDSILEINLEAFKGRTLEDINTIIFNSHQNGNSVITNLNEAVIHEIGHAKLMYGKNYAQADSITDTLQDVHIEGISKTALKNGDECIAECYVLKTRGEKLPINAEELYNQYMKE